MNQKVYSLDEILRKSWLGEEKFILIETTSEPGEEWPRHPDHAALAAELAEAKNENERLASGEGYQFMLDWNKELQARAEAAERALAEKDRLLAEARGLSISIGPDGGALLVWHIGGRYLEAEVPSDSEEGVIEWMFERGPDDFIHWEGGTLNEAIARALAERSES